jgi:hypothetical protein
MGRKCKNAVELFRVRAGHAPDGRLRAGEESGPAKRSKLKSWTDPPYRLTAVHSFAYFMMSRRRTGEASFLCRACSTAAAWWQGAAADRFTSRRLGGSASLP